MSIRISEYTASDWVRLRPLSHPIKRFRYRRIDRAYCRIAPPPESLELLAGQLRGRQVVVTIAFNDFELIQFQVESIRRFVRDAVHLIADNSSDESVNQEIEKHCQGEGVPYVRLPRNPWQGLAKASRSHGQAMNWVWRRILKPTRPARFGFIDHDLFPTRACDPFEPLQRMTFHGDKRWVGQRWFLWAGYCFFRFDAVEHIDLDFSQDWFVGLDTGGANWESLYSHFDPDNMPDRMIYEAPILPGIDQSRAYIEWRDDWLHEVGLAGDLTLRVRKRQVVLQLLQELTSERGFARADELLQGRGDLVETTRAERNRQVTKS